MSCRISVDSDKRITIGATRVSLLGRAAIVIQMFYVTEHEAIVIVSIIFAVGAIAPAVVGALIRACRRGGSYSDCIATGTPLADPAREAIDYVAAGMAPAITTATRTSLPVYAITTATRTSLPVYAVDAASDDVTGGAASAVDEGDAPKRPAFMIVVDVTIRNELTNAPIASPPYDCEHTTTSQSLATGEAEDDDDGARRRCK
jgi:hypothetical protein